jgi:hypothetical protein
MSTSATIRGFRVQSAVLVALAVLALVLSAATSFARPVLASNNGTVKIHEGATENEIEPNDPKVCTFHVHAWNFDENQVLTVDIVGHGGPNAGPSEYHSTITTATDGEHRWEGQTEVIQLAPGMYKLTVDTGNGTTTQDKHKVFKVECGDEGGGEEGQGSLTIRKEVEDNNQDTNESFEFSIDGGASFFLSDDGELASDVDPGTFNVEELLTQAQLDAGWSLTDIDCGEAEATTSASTMGVDVTVGADEDVVCTFTNTLEEGGGGEQPGGGGEQPGGGGEQPGGQTPGEGTLGGNPLPNTALTDGTPAVSVPVAILALVALGLIGAATRAEVRRRS